MMATTDAVIMTDDMTMDYVSTGMMVEPMEGIEEVNENGMSSQAVLYIVIGVCAVVGLVLGILSGRKAAYK